VRYRGRAVAVARAALWEAAGGGTFLPCALCGTPIDMRLPATHRMGPSIEHRIPLALGGSNDLDNLTLAHLSCNCARGARPPMTLGATSRRWL
jgi:5-methylcytosine-specific restriction endonuclease McrA